MERNLTAGQLAGKHFEDDACPDRLSALPNDVLLRILLDLEDAAAAGQTSVLSSRWRRLWTLLPELRFPSSSDHSLIASALAAHEAPLSVLDVQTQDAASESVAAWLPVAARRVSGRLVFTNQVVPGRNDDDNGDKRGAFDLPCLDKATSVSLDLGCLGVAVPRAGVSARLTELCLAHATFRRGPCALGDAVSSRRCPCLQKLEVKDTWGLDDLTIRSDSLRHMELAEVRGLRQLTIVAPALEHLKVFCCFYYCRNRPVADISARQLKVLMWGDLFDRRSVRLGKMKHLQSVCPDMLLVYGASPNRPCLELLRCFKIIQELSLTLAYEADIHNKPYLLEAIKVLPGVTFLHLSIVSNGHAVGASIFHVLEQTACPPGCVKTEDLLLNHLGEVKISEFRGSDHEVTFMKHLFNWAVVVRKMTVSFNSVVTESTAKKLYQILRSFSRPEICMEFYMRKDTVKVLYVPKDH
ncbi:hypothetical protein BS78_02G013100 [Paspalum vaginatum]|nr:hypothetical protein BS78_02G013100 [Paspalum vaginatum]